jgi:hypothetical protein
MTADQHLARLEARARADAEGTSGRTTPIGSLLRDSHTGRRLLAQKLAQLDARAVGETR